MTIKSKSNRLCYTYKPILHLRRSTSVSASTLFADIHIRTLFADIHIRNLKTNMDFNNEIFYLISNTLVRPMFEGSQVIKTFGIRCNVPQVWSLWVALNRSGRFGTLTFGPRLEVEIWKFRTWHSLIGTATIDVLDFTEIYRSILPSEYIIQT